MPLRVRTAPMTYRGPDRLDVTRKSGGPEGHPFAPSWRILGKALAARRAARDLPADAAREIERQAWEAYSPAYLAEMAASRERQPEAWRDLLSRERVVLVCYCRNRERCHRGLLAVLLANLGAIDAGEVGASEHLPF